MMHWFARWTICLSVFSISAHITAQADTRPNILLIISDDQTNDDLVPYMPRVTERIFKQGAWFQNAFITTPACCPSRASILTGTYASKHEVIGNRFMLLKPTIVESLHKSGYYTGLVGKYLNSSDGTPRSEFDYWVSFANGSVEYINPHLNVQGEWVTEKRHSTYAFRDYARGFIKQAKEKNAPWFLMLAPNAPHSPAIPPPGEKLVALDPNQRPNFAESDLSLKPEWVRNIGVLSNEEKSQALHFQAKQRTCLKALDASINTILDDVQAAGILDKTAVFFISDNGVFRGEHNLKSKDSAYEEAVHVPLALRYPPLIPKPVVDTDHLAANIDIAPTIADLAGLPVMPNADGFSLLGVLSSKIAPRKSILLEGWRTKGRVPFVALRTNRYKLIHNMGDIDELYDLESDPFELKNLSGDLTISKVKQALADELVETVKRVRGTLSFKAPHGTLSPKYKASKGVAPADDGNYEADDF